MHSHKNLETLRWFSAEIGTFVLEQKTFHHYNKAETLKLKGFSVQSVGLLVLALPTLEEFHKQLPTQKS